MAEGAPAVDPFERELADKVPPEPGPEAPGAPEGQPAVSDEAKRAAYTGLVGMLLETVNKELVRVGLTPIGAAQSMLISVGAVGTMMKYGFDPDDYPELCLGAGLVWAGYDKYIEFRKLPVAEGPKPAGAPAGPEGAGREGQAS